MNEKPNVLEYAIVIVLVIVTTILQLFGVKSLFNTTPEEQAVEKAMAEPQPATEE